ncbi:hypothetical protein AN958_03290 [Leucoagaricus sp. SymC.cos]|nr:hypothetical protein AN958_03290 [Leucoagaricus sp. SymC.cos]
MIRRNEARSHPHPHAPPLLPREPGLINLPIPLPSIPVLDPIVTPLIQGNNRPQPAPTPAPVTPPAPTSTAKGSPPATGGGSGGGTSGGGGGSGGGSGDPSSSPGGGSSGGDPGGSSGGDPGTGQPTDTLIPPASTGDSGSTGNGSATGTDPIQIPSGTDAPPASSSSRNNFLDSPVANAGNDPSDNGKNGGDSAGATVHLGSGNTGTEFGGSTHTGVTISVPRVSGTPRTGGNEGGGSGGGGDIGQTGAVKKGNLSGGAIAGIVIAILLIVLVVTIILIRRRFRSRRSEHRNRWWFSRNRTSQTYGDRAHGDVGIAGGLGTSGNAALRKSVRSSFETTVDHSQAPCLDMDFDIPALPPMAELRGTPMLINLDSPVSPNVTSLRPPEINVTTTPESRFSVGTVSSLESDDQGQWLIVNRSSLAPEASSPMSVRPFSPTESFAFPKPPTDKSSGDWGSQFSRPPSLHTLNASSTSGNGVKNTGGMGAGIAEEDVPALPVPSPAANPFNDPDPIALHAVAVQVLGVPGAIDVAAANADPFADPTLPPEPTTPSAVHPEFMEIENIKRPFIPTLVDELPVEIGDKVKILRMFDDGWALVEKNPVYGLASMKGKEKQPDKGLIPIDCFRDHGLDLSAFISSKRVSSYSQSSSKYTAGGAAS